MKLNLEPTKNVFDDRSGRATKTATRMNKPGAIAEAGAPKRFRRLKWNELVSHGDFVLDVSGGFELWDGPTGFRADAFVKPIYRRDKSRPVAARKSP